jgi:hypothetical protein
VITHASHPSLQTQYKSMRYGFMWPLQKARLIRNMP